VRYYDRVVPFTHAANDQDADMITRRGVRDLMVLKAVIYNFANNPAGNPER
jgi:hypothetical protein